MSSQGTFNRKEEHDKTCEEPLSLLAEEGYGYYPSAVVGHRLGQYEIVRKVYWRVGTAIEHMVSSDGLEPPAFGSACMCN